MSSSTVLDASKASDGVSGDSFQTEAKQTTYIKVDGNYWHFPLRDLKSLVLIFYLEAPKFDLESYIANYKGAFLTFYLKIQPSS